jgi:hypothetical protein
VDAYGDVGFFDSEMFLFIVEHRKQIFIFLRGSSHARATWWRIAARLHQPLCAPR